MTYTIAVCTVKKTPDDGQRNCPKHVEFYSKNKFEKLVHLVGFIKSIYHDARSPERQTNTTVAALVWESWREDFLNYENRGILITPIESFKFFNSAIPYRPCYLTTERIYISPEFLVTFVSCMRNDYRIFIVSYCRGNIDRQCMSSVTLWRVRLTIVALENNRP